MKETSSCLHSYFSTPELFEPYVELWALQFSSHGSCPTKLEHLAEFFLLVIVFNLCFYDVGMWSDAGPNNVAGLILFAGYLGMYFMVK